MASARAEGEPIPPGLTGEAGVCRQSGLGHVTYPLFFSVLIYTVETHDGITVMVLLWR